MRLVLCGSAAAVWAVHRVDSGRVERTPDYVEFRRPDFGGRRACSRGPIFFSAEDDAVADREQKRWTIRRVGCR